LKQYLKLTTNGFKPNGWSITSLDQLAKLNAGGTPSRFKKEYWDNGNIPWLSSGEIRFNIITASNEKITRLGLSESAAKLLPIGTVLIAITGQGLTRGRTAMLGIEASTNQSVIGINCESGKLSNLFLWYYLQNQYWNLRNISQGSNQAGLNLGLLKHYRILVPQLKEQQKIALILTKVDELIQKTNQIIEQTQRLKKGLIQNLLTKGIGHKKFRTVNLGSKTLSIRIPDLWEVKPLSEIARVIDVRHSTPKYTTRGFSLVLPNNVRSEGLDLRNTKFTNKEDYLYMTGGGRKPAKGDIIYSRNATFGIASRVEDEIEFSLGQDLVLIKPDKIDPYLLYLILNSRSITIQLTRLSTGSTFQRINLELIRNYIIPYPKDIDEQKKISRILESISNFIYVSNRRRKILNYLKVSLMQNLLTGKIRVKV
jgi:type I restriction enzyme, S subunit